MTMQWGRYNCFKLYGGASPACRQAQIREQSSTELIHSLLLQEEDLHPEYLCIIE